MIDQKLEQLALSTRQPEFCLPYAQALERAGRKDDARKQYLIVLKQAPSLVHAQRGWVRTGGPWVEKENNVTFTVYNVHILGPNDVEEIYDLTFDRNFLTTHESDYFSQDEAIEAIDNIESKNGLMLATAGELVNAMLTVDDVEQLDIQPVKSKQVHSDLRYLFEGERWTVTGTRIRYGVEGAVIDRYGREDQYEIPGDIRGRGDYFRNLSDGESLVRKLFRTPRPINEMDMIIKRFLEVKTGARLWRFHRGHESGGESSVSLERGRKRGHGLGVGAGAGRQRTLAALVISQRRS